MEGFGVHRLELYLPCTLTCHGSAICKKLQANIRHASPFDTAALVKVFRMLCFRPWKSRKSTIGGPTFMLACVCQRSPPSRQECYRIPADLQRR